LAETSFFNRQIHSIRAPPIYYSTREPVGLRTPDPKDNSSCELSSGFCLSQKFA
jgi:hypothetical protein